MTHSINTEQSINLNPAIAGDAVASTDHALDIIEYELSGDEDLPERVEAENSLSLSYWSGVVFFILIVAFLVWFVSQVESYLTDSSQMPISELIIQGQRQYVTDDEIRDVLLENPSIRNYFSINVDTIQSKIESLPWVYRTSVRKSWPSTIRVYIQEQPVTAFWNDDQLLNKYGEVFSAEVGRASNSLVKLYSPDDRIKPVLSKYQKLNNLLQLNNYHITSLSLNIRNALTVVLNNGITLRLGREDTMARVQRFIDHFPALDKENIDYIDLRYDTGFSVGWKKTMVKSNNDD